MNLPVDIIRRVHESWARRLAACEGKVPFESRAIASDVARRRNRTGKPGTAYKCRFCSKWHIGGPR